MSHRDAFVAALSCVPSCSLANDNMTESVQRPAQISHTPPGVSCELSVTAVGPDSLRRSDLHSLPGRGQQVVFYGRSSIKQEIFFHLIFCLGKSVTFSGLCSQRSVDGSKTAAFTDL